MAASILRHDVPPIDDLQPPEDGFIVHEAVEITNGTACATLTRHVGLDAGAAFATWTVERVDGVNRYDWIDDPALIDDAVEVLQLLAAEFRKAITGQR